MGTKAASSPGLSRERARDLALSAGFAEAGLVALPHANQERDAERFRSWVHAGRAGTMQYLERRVDGGQLVRERVAVPFPWARSALVCFAQYLTRPHRSRPKRQTRGADGSRAMPGQAVCRRIRRMPKASGSRRIITKCCSGGCAHVEAQLHEQFGEFESRAYVDTGPVVERVTGRSGGSWAGSARTHA